MQGARLFVFNLAAVIIFSGYVAAQADEICGETGNVPWLNSSYVYGKISLNGFDPAEKLPKITVILYDRRMSETRVTIDRSGNYCFRDVNGSGGFLVVEVEGLEVARRSLPTGGPPQFRQDFEVQPVHPGKQRPPSAISAKNNYPRSGKNAELFEKAAEAEKAKNLDKAVQLLKELVTSDSTDFMAWAKLGSIYFDQGKYSEAESAFRKAIDAKPEYTPAIINLGRVYLIQKRVDAAIQILEKATQNEPTAARAFQLLGEAYLLARKGTLGVKALNEAIRLDPVGMAECHLLIARLYDLAGAKQLASREYRLFLEKMPTHPEKKKFERYIKENPEETDEQ